MSFWNLSDNSTIETTGNFEMGGGDIAPMPNGTQLLAVIDEAKIDSYDGQDYISVRWNALKGEKEEYKNRKTFQKLKVFDPDPKVSDKAKRMLANIDANAGGKLIASGQAPTPENLMNCLGMKPMIIKLAVWEMDRDGEKKTGNWVQSVASKDSVPQPVQQQSQQKPSAGPGNPNAFDDDVPFQSLIK